MHPHQEHRQHKVERRRVASMLKGYATGGAVHEDEGEDKALIRKTVRKTAEEASAEIEKCCRVFPEIGNTSKAPTGEPYVTLVAGGVKDEGEGWPVLYATPHGAIAAWFEAALKYVSLGDVLYWRERPIVECCFYLPSTAAGEFLYKGKDPRPRRALVLELYSVYSRLLVSDSPIIGA